MRISFLLLGLLAMLPSVAAAGESLLDQGIAEYRAESYEEAIATLSDCSRQQPGSATVAYYLGLSLMQTGDLSGATGQFTAALERQPGMHEAYLELIECLYLQDRLPEARQRIAAAEQSSANPAAIAFLKGKVLAKQDDAGGAILAFTSAKKTDAAYAQQADFQIAQLQLQAGDMDAARESLRAVIADNPSSELANFAKEYERRMAALPEGYRMWRLFVGVNYQYDDNVLVKPSTDIAGLNLPSGHDQSSSQNLRLLYEAPSSGPWLFNAQYSLYNNSYFRLDQYSQLSQTLSLVPAYRLPKAVLSLPVTYSHTLLDYTGYSQQLSIKPTATLMFAPQHLGQAGFGYSWRDYLQAPVSVEEDRDAHGYSGQLGYLYLFAEARGMANIRYEFSFDDAAGNNWSNIGNRLTLDLVVPLARQTSAVVSLDGWWQEYLNSHTAYGVKRSDSSYAATATLSHELVERVFLNLQYSHYITYSNIPLYEYDRNVYSAGLELRF